MRRVLPLLLVLFFVIACAPTPAIEIPPTFTPTLIVFTPTFTSIPPTETVTPVMPTQTSTPEVCDPRAVDFCITVGHFLLQRPINPPDNMSVDVTYRYASTANGTRDPHHGVEFYNKFGTPVYAAADGMVLFAGPDDQAIYSPWVSYYGNLVVIQHAGDLYTLYAHLSKVTVEAGKNIRAGEQIGEVGQTGVAIGSHLHFEVRQGNVENYSSTLNPEFWLIPNQDETGQLLGALQISALGKDGNPVKRAEFTLQGFNAQSQPLGNIYYGVTYSAEMLNGVENAGIGDLPAGRYRLVLQYNGQHFERWVEVKSGRLTQVVFTANQ